MFIVVVAASVVTNGVDTIEVVALVLLTELVVVSAFVVNNGVDIEVA